MKEVVRGITEALPEFRDYNRDGMVRMFDLFSRHSDDIVLKEGHRIFNIHDKSDFLRFQNDLIMVIEEIRRTHGGGVLIISSLSPLINNADHTDLMKFLQVLIARSKSYNFTNLYDLAANVHPEEITNSVEYLMDGIAEFREKDGKYSLRLKGFKQGVVSKDWIEYSCNGRNLVLTSSFHEQRIL
jgi:KaiC/GvpD/RAD55 family RecA-like ATPase